MKPSDLSPAQLAELGIDFQDHQAFCRESLSIRDLGGSVVALELSPGQLKLNEAIRRQRKRGKPVRLVVLKTRRSFFTAGSCAEMFHDVPFFPGRRGLVIADKFKPAALEAFDYLLQYQRRYRPFTRHGAGLKLPRLVKDTQQEIRWDNGSGIEVLSAEGGEIRGGGRHWTLLDELAFWRNAQKTLTGVLNMVPYLPETAVIAQSTANGIGGEFYDLCQLAQDPANPSGWEFLFFGWLEHPIYQLAFDTLADKTKLQASLSPEEHVLQSMHGATLEQLNWRRKTISTECRGDVNTFHQEYPTTAEEAFLASGRPVFDHQALMRHPVTQGQPGELQVHEEGPQQRKLIFIPGEHGALTIWKHPQVGRRYVASADPSKGIDVSRSKRGSNPDFCASLIADADTGVQVALLRARIRPIAFAEYVSLVCRWYNWAYLVPEANDPGFIDALVRTGYPLEWIYVRQRDPTDRRPGTIDEIGFETTSLTREWLISAAEDAVRTMAITITSQVVISECTTFVIKPNGKKEHKDDHHDDTVIGLGLLEIGRRTMPKRKPVTTGGSGRAMIRQYGKRPRDEDDE